MKKWLLLLPVPFLQSCAPALLGFAIGTMLDMAALENRTACHNEALIQTVEYAGKTAQPLESSEIRNLIDEAFKECMKGKFGGEAEYIPITEEELCRSRGMIYNPNIPIEDKCFR